MRLPKKQLVMYNVLYIKEAEMTAKIRKQIYIESSQQQQLKRMVKETGFAEAEIIRQAIDRHILQTRRAFRDPQSWERERAFLATLVAAGPVNAAASWRREDLYER